MQMLWEEAFMIFSMIIFPRARKAQLRIFE
jgi:hypothetical protein